MMQNVRHFAARQLRDFDACTPGTMFADQPSITATQAYAVVAEVCRLRQQRGESLIGYKIGCTSPAIQQQFRIAQPVFGRLFDSQCWPSGIDLPLGRFASLAIEGELAVRLAQDLPAAELSDSQLSAAIESVLAVIELHNFVFHSPEPSVEELIANNGLHAGFVYATDSSPSWHVGSDTLRIEIDDCLVATVPGTQLISTVFDSLRWLACQLGHHALNLKAGQTILCGSVANLFPISAGCRIAVTTDRLGSAECTITENAPAQTKIESS